MRLKLISCEIFYRELCWAVARSPNTVDIEFLPKGLHDIGSEGMSARLQAVLDRVDDPRYEAVLLGYGLCNNGIAGLRPGKYRLIVPRAHDCITLFPRQLRALPGILQQPPRRILRDHGMDGTGKGRRRTEPAFGG